MAKQLNVNLAFTADTSKAKQQLQDLQRTLSTLTESTVKSSPLGITDELNKAIVDVSKLEAALKNSTSQTGKLDLGQFRQELDKAGLDAQKVSLQLRTLGSDGVKAFSQLTQSIMNAELPLRRTNTLLTNFATTLKNAARWQISSSILHGFVGSVQSAYYYAQDLNESLNNIRIVTGKSTDEMAAFAEQANEAAKALSTTTTDYTDAALIYYQQGLSDEDVIARTDTTIKLANVARESAADVSQQMTAIWNNFYDGSRSLEYYADVITALGAATASSSSEITEGLEKFAAVADSVGLSYEYATSALATVTATTRQSADIVGNAFKTLFARLEGLNLGETLDDGTTLNKYSEALDKVGISIKTASGEMKSMDQILDDLGQRWDSLSNDQQVALAQTVAGVRQYTQLIALMENWEFFQQNLAVAQGSEGTLQKQADIYAESWEAAKKEVQASLEDIYNEIFNDKLFIDLANAFAKVTKEVGNIIEAFGGLSGMLPFISSMILKMFGTEITASLDNFIYRLKMSTEQGKQEILGLREAFNKELLDMTADETTLGSSLAEIYNIIGNTQNTLIKKTTELNDINKSLTEQEQRQAEILQDNVKLLANEAIEALKVKENVESGIDVLINMLSIEGTKGEGIIPAETFTGQHGKPIVSFYHSQDTLKKELEDIKNIQIEYSIAQKLKEEFFKTINNYGQNSVEFENYTKLVEKFIVSLENINPLTDKTTSGIVKIREALSMLKSSSNIEEIKKAFIDLEIEINNTAEGSLDKLLITVDKDSEEFKELNRIIRQLKEEFPRLAQSTEEFIKKFNNINTYGETARKTINNFKGDLITFSNQFVLMSRVFSSFGMALSSINGIINTLNNDTLTAGEKFTNLTVSLGIFFDASLRTAELFNKAYTGLITLYNQWTAAILLNTAAERTNGAVRMWKIGLERASGLTLQELIAKSLALVAAKDLDIKTTEKQIIVDTLKKGLAEEEISLTNIQIGQLYSLIARKTTDITVTKILSSGISNLIEKVKNLITNNAKLLIGIAVVATAVAAIAAAYDLYTDSLKKNSAAEVAHTKELKEKQDSLVKTKENIISLTESYKELTSEVKSNSDFTSDLRTQVFDLCNQYELYDLALKALVEDYDELGNSIKEAQIEQDKKVVSTAESTQRSAQSSIASKFWSDASIRQRDHVPSTQGWQRSFDVGLLTGSDLQKTLFEDFGVLSDTFGHIDIETFVKAATEQREKLVKALEAEGTESAQKLIDLINNNQELFDIYAEATTQRTEALRDEISLENSNNISSYEDYINAINKISQDKEYLSTFTDKETAKEDARKTAEVWMSEFSGASSEYAKKYALSAQIAEALGEDIDKVSKKLEKYNSTSLTFISLYTERIKLSGKTLEEFTKDLEHYLNITGNIQNRDSVVGLLKSLASGEEFNEADLTEFFSQDNNGFGMNQDEFVALGQGEQTVALLHYFAENQQVIEANKEKTLQELESYKNDVTKDIEEIDKQIEELKNKSGEYLEEDYLNKFVGVVDDEYLSVVEKLAQGMEDELTEAEKEIAESIESDTFLTVPGDLDELREYIRVKKELKKLEDSRTNSNNEIDAYEAAKEALEEATSAATKYKAAHEGITSLSGEIDEIQSAYESLNDIIKSYNQNNGFTLDTLQSLLSLDPLYLQALEMDGNQLSINKEYLIELIKARLEDTKALIYEEGYNKLLALAEKDASVAAAAAAIQQAEAGTAAEEAGLKAEAAAARWNKLTAAMHGEISKEAKIIIDDTNKRIQAVDNVIKNLNVSSFDKIVKTGSSGGGSSKEKKLLEDEIDRYYDLNNAIKTVNNSLDDYKARLDKLKSYQDHYQGKTLIKSLEVQNSLIQKQSELLNKQIENYKAYYKEQSRELDELKTKITSYGGIFDGNTLTNYAEVMTDAVNAYNAATNENAEKQYEKIKNALSRYQELFYSEMAETEKNVADALQEQLENQFKIIENNLKGWEVEVDLKLDANEFKRTWRDFIKTIEQDFRKIYKNLRIDSAATTDNFTTYLQDAQTRMQEIYDVEAEIRKMEASKDANGVVQIDSSMLFGSISEAQEKLKELQTELVENGNNLQQLYEQVWNTYIEGLDQAADNFDDITNRVEHLTNMLEYEKQIIELLYGDEAFDLMSKYYSVQQGNIEAQIDSTRVQAEFWEEQFYKAFNMNKEKHNIDLEDMSTWTSDMRKAYDEMIESQEKLNDLIIQGIENFRDYYINNIAETLRQMDKSIWGMKFDELKEDWDFIQKRADEYLDDVEGAYAIQTLANKIDEGIASTSDLKAQQKLAKLREDEITMLREKERLTQADIDLAEARYQIALKEIALQEAQNNKTGMKLVRNTSGNWTYQYVADEDDILNKQQELLDAYNNLYKIADEAYKHAMELAMELYEEYKEKVKTIAEDITLTEEEKMLKIKELQDQYLPEIEAAMTNTQIYEQETLMAAAAVFAEVCEQDADAYTTLTDLQKDLVDAVREQHLEDYEEIREAILNNYNEITSKAKDSFREMNENSKTAAADVIRQWDKNTNDSVKGAMNDAFDALEDYTREFERELVNLERISGRAIVESGGVARDIDEISYAIEEAVDKTYDLATIATSNLDTLRGFVNNVETAFNGVINKINEAIRGLQQYLSLMESVANIPKQSFDIDTSTPSNNNSNNKNSGGSGSGSGNFKKNNSSTTNTGLTAGYASSDWRSGAIKNEIGSTIGYNSLSEKLDLEDILALLKQNSSGNPVSITRSRYDYGFASGGYTGEWGTDGRLAVLHQKELVLNEDDTSNMLSAVKAIRDIAGLNESISQTIASSIGQLVMHIVAAGGGNFNTSTSDNTNNVFNITAEFPNADDVQTIRDAILSLPNLASQFIHQR